MTPLRLIITVTGVPGVGKTTFAQGLAEQLRGRHINLSNLADKQSLIADLDEERDTPIIDLEKVSELLMQLIGTSKEPLIIEGHFAHDVVPPKATNLIFVLRRAPWRLEKELEARGYGREKVRENVEAELVGVSFIEAVEAYGIERVCEIDTTDRTQEEVIEEALSIIRGDGVCDRGRIDWLGCAEVEGLLEGK